MISSERIALIARCPGVADVFTLLDEAEARIAALEAALIPFGLHYEAILEYLPGLLHHSHVGMVNGDRGIRLEDLKRARDEVRKGVIHDRCSFVD